MTDVVTFGGVAVAVTVWLAEPDVALLTARLAAWAALEAELLSEPEPQPLSPAAPTASTSATRTSRCRRAETIALSEHQRATEGIIRLG